MGVHETLIEPKKHVQKTCGGWGERKLDLELMRDFFACLDLSRTCESGINATPALDILSLPPRTTRCAHRPPPAHNPLRTPAPPPPVHNPFRTPSPHAQPVAHAPPPCTTRCAHTAQPVAHAPPVPHALPPPPCTTRCAHPRAQPVAHAPPPRRTTAQPVAHAPPPPRTT